MRKDLPLLLPRHITVGLSRQRIQHVRLDAMQQLHRSPLRRNPVVPSPRHMERRIELEDAIGEGVAPAEIVEEPAVDLGITQGLLNLADTLVWSRQSLQQASYRRATEPSMRRLFRPVVVLQYAPWQSSMHQSLRNSG